MEGIKNKIFKKEHVELLAEERWNICKECPLLDNKGDTCYVVGTQPCCGSCGCSLGFKIRSLSDNCPEGKWKAVTNIEEALQINDIIQENGN